MSTANFVREQLVVAARFSASDLTTIRCRRRQHNQLGFGYQLAFVRLMNRFPAQTPLEIDEDILMFTSLQLDIPQSHIDPYQQRQPTISKHQDAIRHYLSLREFKSSVKEAETFVFDLAASLEQTSALMVQLRRFLKEQCILEPAYDTLRRLIQTERERARSAIYTHISQLVTFPVAAKLDALLDREKQTYTPLYYLKRPPRQASSAAFVKLSDQLEVIQSTGIFSLDLAWLNNNFQRSLARYARNCSTYRLRNLTSAHRYTALICFLLQLYQDTFDAMVQMYDKLITKVYNKAGNEVALYLKKRRRQIHMSLSHYNKILDILLNADVRAETLRTAIYERVDQATLKTEQEELQTLLNNKHYDIFSRVVARHGYLRQFSPALLKCLELKVETSNQSTDQLLQAIGLLDEMNRDNRHKLPNNVPIGFIPSKWLPQVLPDGKPHKAAWECALLTVLRDQVKSGNLSVQHSKRFATLGAFFIPESQWADRREAFFKRSGLPENPSEVADYLKERLNGAYDQFLQILPENPYVRIDHDGWKITTDTSEKLDKGADARLDALRDWLGTHIRTIKLPDLLIEVDNELHFSHHFMPEIDKRQPSAQKVCEILAALMAHACEIGTHTMAQITKGISYNRLKQISEWQLHEENQRLALAVVVNAISQLGVSHVWGEGKTSSSDGQRFGLRRKVLSQAYSHTFHDFALEFYNFVADNYAPYFSIPHECTDRDAPLVLDGILYNESDLDIEEHYTDTHGFTDINFAAFAMLGKRFVPRIKGLHKHAIFHTDKEKDYGPLGNLLRKRDRLLKLDWIVEQWDRMGHFYASLECGHVTASTALRRLNGFTGANHFYRANRELGRLFRTEHTLAYMSDPALRQRNRRGLLKGEQIHALARDLRLGKRGRINQAGMIEQRYTCSSLVLIMACIIYWQAKEIERVIDTYTPNSKDIDLSLLPHISPISWSNLIIHGEYVLNRTKVKC